MPKMIYLPITLIVMLTMIGCESDENRRLADLAERQLQRQHEQNQNETARATRHLAGPLHEERQRDQ